MTHHISPSIEQEQNSFLHFLKNVPLVLRRTMYVLSTTIGNLNKSLKNHLRGNNAQLCDSEIIIDFNVISIQNYRKKNLASFAPISSVNLMFLDMYVISKCHPSKKNYT